MNTLNSGCSIKKQLQPIIAAIFLLLILFFTQSCHAHRYYSHDDWIPIDTDLQNIREVRNMLSIGKALYISAVNKAGISKVWKIDINTSNSIAEAVDTGLKTKDFAYYLSVGAGSILYAFIGTEVYKLDITSNAAKWISIKDGLENGYVQLLYSDDKTLWASTSSGKLFEKDVANDNPWKEFSTAGLPKGKTFALQPIDNNLYLSRRYANQINIYYKNLNDGPSNWELFGSFNSIINHLGTSNQSLYVSMYTDLRKIEIAVPNETTPTSSYKNPLQYEVIALHSTDGVMYALTDTSEIYFDDGSSADWKKLSDSILDPDSNDSSFDGIVDFTITDNTMYVITKLGKILKLDLAPNKK
ncbi:MAG TPA: hypothetical protein DEA62_01925 [Coxiellaceae bacterium]|nr:MAG: hypothetical protein A2V89_01335 [Gammaproteobacteria bacterium RBG_16_37_9]HBS51735.1 hypothetical protein [Coxiellaceae bacterium]